MDEEYRSIRLRRAVLNKVEKYILEHPEMGYKSLADFVTDAIREKLIELHSFESRKPEVEEVVQE